MLLQSLYFSRFLPNRPRPLSSFDTHARWQPVTQSARSRWSYGKIEDCEQSNANLQKAKMKIVRTSSHNTVEVSTPSTQTHSVRKRRNSVGGVRELHKISTHLTSFTHRRTGRGGEGGCSPPKFWATQIFWAARENLGKASFLRRFRDFKSLFWRDKYFLF